MNKLIIWLQDLNRESYIRFLDSLKDLIKIIIFKDDKNFNC